VVFRGVVLLLRSCSISGMFVYSIIMFCEHVSIAADTGWDLNSYCTRIPPLLQAHLNGCRCGWGISFGIVVASPSASFQINSLCAYSTMTYPEPNSATAAREAVPTIQIPNRLAAAVCFPVSTPKVTSIERACFFVWPAWIHRALG